MHKIKYSIYIYNMKFTQLTKTRNNKIVEFDQGKS